MNSNSLRKRCHCLLLILALKSSLSFTTTSCCVGAAKLHHHSKQHQIQLSLQSNDDELNTNIQCNNVDGKRSNTRRKPITPVLSSVVAASFVFALNDPSCAMSNDSIIPTSFQNTRQAPVASFLHPIIPAPTLYYSFSSSLRVGADGDTATASSAKDVIVEENKRIAQQMKEVEDRDGRSTLTDVIDEEDERIAQQMQEVGITQRIDTGIGAATVYDVREESQRIIMQQNSKSVPTNKIDRHTTQQPSRTKGAGTTVTSKTNTQQKAQSNVRLSSAPQKIEIKELQTSDIKKIAAENKIEVELKDAKTSTSVIKIDRENFTKVKVIQPPFLRYLPSSVQPLISSQFKSVQVLKSIPDDQLFFASVVAGSLTEVIRTTLLYPLSTVKARVQARSSGSTNKKRTLLRKLKITWLTFLFETKKGGLYAGLVPSLLIATPASGVYAGTKEISRRAFTMAIPFFQAVLPHDEARTTLYSALVVSLLAAFVADIAALALRTPTDILSLRLQVFGDTNVNSDLSSWLKDSISLLPAMVICDAPYLLSRIFLNAAILTSGESIGIYVYDVETVGVACICAFLTTPFDVARTRILLPTLPNPNPNEVESSTRRLVAPSKYREQRRQKLSVSLTMKRIAAEGNGGIRNLYTGWLERTIYLGLGRAWLDPFRIIGYLGLRDAILLKFFE